MMSPSQLLESLQHRYATKVFDSAKKIPADHLHVLQEALRLSPSSFGLQFWKFIRVDSPSLRQQLVAHSWNQTQIVDASHLFVLCRPAVINEALVDRYVESIASTRGVPIDSLAGYRGMMMGVVQGRTPEQLAAWADKQIYIALGFLLQSCAVLQIDACPVEGFDPAAYDQVLGLETQGLKSVVVCPVGYRSEADKYASLSKVRFATDEVFIVKS